MIELFAAGGMIAVIIAIVMDLAYNRRPIHKRRNPKDWR